ncbi:MAG: energy-coupling factor ABC transporter permease [Verrucomicrobiae bacterium]|nr:energy-coupling factor ABC transporter permease [Verrucomicrobiae bacterium]
MSDPSQPFERWEEQYLSAFGSAAEDVKAYHRYWRNELWEKRLAPSLEKLAPSARPNFCAALLRRLNETAAVAVAAWVSVVLPGFLVALALGLQPLIAHKEDGTPLFFPFGFAITLPAVLVPHLFIGAGEAVLTVLVWRFARARKWCAA